MIMTAKAVIKLIDITPDEQSKIELLKAYAFNYMQQDRKHVAEHAKAENGGTWRTDEGHLASSPAYVIKDSIINAPEIELP